jgi:beta-lactamase class D
MNKYMYSSLICFSFLLFISFSTSCSNAEFEEKNFKEIFDEHDVDGCFILFDVNNNKTIKYNPDKCCEEFLPASTFKIPHSLIAMELGIITDTSFTLKWDGKHRSIDVWNRDHNFQSAVKYSVVWFYEEIGKRVGEHRMSEWLNKIDYGNKDVSGSYPYWIIGNLRITPDEQMEFIKKFYFENLPFKKENIRTLKKILILEKSGNYKLTAKTGWADLNGENVGWIVGYLEEENNSYLFVTNITVGDNPPTNFASLRLEITKKIFSKLNLMQN